MNENNSGLLNYIELLKSHEAALKNKLLDILIPTM